jgi:predicted anti-sigma-YlaC factor YlaD
MAEPTLPRRDYTCQEVVELASEYLEGAMTSEQMATFEVHLNFCDGCFRFLDQVRATASLARALPEEEIPDEVRAELLQVFNDWRRR